jgi:hypothetical protein
MRSVQVIRNIFLLILFSQIAVAAQTTEFTYQGSLRDGMSTANGNYDFVFALHATETGGTAMASLPRSNVAVADGTFAVQLDFGPQFPGADRWLEIHVRPAGVGSYQILQPRSRVNSTPYAIKSLTAENAINLGGVLAGQYVVTTDPRMTNARNPLPGSSNYIQNTPTLHIANFAISGNASANIVSAAQYNHGTSRLLGIGPGSNTLFAGIGAGGPSGGENSFFGTSAGNTNQGSNNSFFGSGAGRVNTTGANNSFFGMRSGDINTTGSNNSLYGRQTGLLNMTGSFNSFFGTEAGQNSTTSNNSFFGYRAGATNSSASGNSFFGYLAGELSTGDGNSFFGDRAGKNNKTGVENSYFGTSAGEADSLGSANFNSFFGYQAGANNTSSGNSFFGSSAGAGNTSGQANSFFGNWAGRNNTTAPNNSFFGYLAGNSNTTGGQNSFFGSRSGEDNTTGLSNSFFGNASGGSNTTGSSNAFFGAGSGGLNTVGNNNAFFGMSAGVANTDGGGNTFNGYRAGHTNTTGSGNTFLGHQAGQSNTVGDLNTVIGWNANTSGIVSHATAIGAEAVVNTSNTIVLGRNFANPSGSLGDDVVVYGFLRATLSPSGGSVDVCQNAGTFNFSSCSSSMRYKSEVATFGRGLEVVRRLRPIVFNWNSGGARDVGFGAEEVAAVEPLLSTYNSRGEIEGVKYKQITTVLVNAINEQQQIIERQQLQIDALMKLVCVTNRNEKVCRPR